MQANQSLSQHSCVPITPVRFECHSRPRADASRTNVAGYVRSRTCGCQQRVWRCAKLVERNPASNDVAADLARVVSIATSVFLTIGGDLTESGKVGELRRYRDAVNSLCVPVFSLFGGHDGIEERCAADVTRTGRYEQFLGPAWYSFDWGGWHFVMYPNEEECFSKVDRRHMRQWLEQEFS
jgi:hypothetical protein